MTTLQKRLAMSGILVPLVIYTVFFSPMWVFFLTVCGFIFIGFFEFLELAAKKGNTMNRYFALGLAAIIPFATLVSFEVAALGIITLAIFVYHFQPAYQENAFTNSVTTTFGMVYVVLFLSQFLKIRMLDHGPAWVFVTILIIKGADAGAYFIGRKIGKTRLIEHISPKKSVEGSVGGFLTGVVLAMLSKVFLPHAPLFHLMMFGIILGALAQLGDLAESLLKRGAGIKDSGQLPGLGGILDVLDSLLISAPFVFAYLTFFSDVLL